LMIRMRANIKPVLARVSEWFGKFHRKADREQTPI
jgi:hypothetical protein